MQIAIASDLHENHHHFAWFARECKKRNIEECYFLGDLINPGLLKELISLGMKLTCVPGNNDGDLVTMATIMAQTGNSFSARSFMEVTVNGKSLFLTHYPLLADNAVRSQKYDAVFYGHNHEQLEEMRNNTLLVNPGELAGSKTGNVTFYIWDSETNTGEFINNPNPQPAK